MDWMPTRPGPMKRLTFKERLRPVIGSPDMLGGDVLRLAVDTSTGDHKQIYLLVTHDAAGAVLGTWGVECFDDCKPMEDPPGRSRSIRTSLR